MEVKGFLGNWIVRNVLGAVILVLALVVAASVLLRVITEHSKTVQVPDFTNMSVEQVSALAKEKELRVEVTDSIYARRMARGAVVSQNPKAGESVKRGRRVRLTTNAVMPKMVTMPDLVGLSMRQAKAELLSRGLFLGRLIYVTDMATNNVLRQLYRNSEIRPETMIESGAVVDLMVGLSDLDCTTSIPDVVGMKYLRAVDAIHDYSLNVSRLRFDNTVRTYSDSLNSVVYLQSPFGTEVASHIGDEVELSLTLDPEKIQIN